MYISLIDDMQCLYLVNLRHCTHLIGVQKSVKSVDFFDTVILSLLFYIGPKLNYNCGIEFKSSLILICKYTGCIITKEA